jgi:hypothetical protein
MKKQLFLVLFGSFALVIQSFGQKKEDLLAVRVSDTLYLLENNETAKFIETAWYYPIITETPPKMVYVSFNELFAINERKNNIKK